MLSRALKNLNLRSIIQVRTFTKTTEEMPAKVEKKTIIKPSKAQLKAQAKAAAPKVKRAPSPYIVFCTEQRPAIKAANPDASFGQLGKLLGEAWAKLGDAQKKVYILNIYEIYQLLTPLF
jgi:hypothetical protein